MTDDHSKLGSLAFSCVVYIKTIIDECRTKLNLDFYYILTCFKKNYLFESLILLIFLRQKKKTIEGKYAIEIFVPMFMCALIILMMMVVILAKIIMKVRVTLISCVLNEEGAAFNG